MTSPPTPSSGRPPEEEWAKRNREIQRSSDSRDRGGRTRGCGGKRGSGKNGGGGDHHHRRGDDSGSGGEQAYRVLVWLRAPPRGQRGSQQPGRWPQLWQGQKEGGGTVRENVQRGTARQPPPARRRSRARTTAR